MAASTVVAFWTIAASLLQLGARTQVYGITPEIYFDISTAPWHVAVIVDDVYKCAGSVISDEWVLTAAHCTKHPADTFLPVAVRVGSNETNSGGQTYKVAKVVNHPDFVSNKNNDISVLKLSERLKLGKTVNKVTLPGKDLSSSPAVHSKVAEVTWVLRSAPDRGGRNFAKVTVFVLDFSRCKDKFGADVHPDQALQICGGSHGRDSLHGDTGGSLVKDDVILGVVAYGGQVCGHYPAVYTKVAVFTDWIQQITGL